MMSLNELRETLLNMRGNSLTDALFILVDHMVEADEGSACESFGNTGILVSNELVEIVDIEKGRSIAHFGLTNKPIDF